MKNISYDKTVAGHAETTHLANDDTVQTPSTWGEDPWDFSDVKSRARQSVKHSDGNTSETYHIIVNKNV